ncbi:RnfABCDGE type electron transport complex subunit G [Selenomonas ruminantium]|uniref:RnfABCDGE type electron transport complex subunit G n=1 Tax=Selenomonas ruminantium TaxID=971 RepID=UPI00156A26CC|nr:RnfABCDGE type electron transport complex subunit G [Selenomonas ruminantium]
MSSNEHSTFKIAFNLAAACFISGIVIGSVYFVTAPVAAQKAEEMKQESMKSLVPEAEHFTEVAGHEGWFVAEKGGKAIAYIVPSESKGYGGKIKMLVAVTADSKVIDFSILEHNETPGLGDNAQKPEFRQMFAGKDADKLEVTKDPANKENIQAMTGATISSRAVTKGVREAVEAVASYKAEGGAK